MFIEQAERLKKAGWEQETAEMGFDSHGHLNGIYVIDAPSVEEMMEFVKEYGSPKWNPFMNQWTISYLNVFDKDLTEVLVKATIIALEKRRVRE